jgi:hypothetical protein
MHPKSFGFGYGVSQSFSHGAQVMAKASKPAAKKSATAGKASKQLGQKVTRVSKPTRKEIRQEVPRRPMTGK